eukprot:4885149-Pleurochrysis_carterae.AAC.1
MTCLYTDIRIVWHDVANVQLDLYKNSAYLGTYQSILRTNLRTYGYFGSAPQHRNNQKLSVQSGITVLYDSVESGITVALAPQSDITDTVSDSLTLRFKEVLKPARG